MAEQHNLQDVTFSYEEGRRKLFLIRAEIDYQKAGELLFPMTRSQTGRKRKEICASEGNSLNIWKNKTIGFNIRAEMQDLRNLATTSTQLALLSTDTTKFLIWLLIHIQLFTSFWPVEFHCSPAGKNILSLISTHALPSVVQASRFPADVRRTRY
ncbi:Hypothetical predicted protein [Podarcis lilfordi]|uniref:Uncharacterized protein n=1 Tax=Podarcis lilfordi TaxID=74358 RepID=A0AA35K066_9SAUR|nr:Hypothetical predicted protein [Podarcis lilfordi]